MAELEIKATWAMRFHSAGVILSAGAMLAVLLWLLTEGGSGLFAHKVEVKTYMPDATGLEANAPVRLDGIQVGTVKHVAISHYLDMQRAVRVDLRVDARFLSKIPADSQTSIGSDTLIGDKFVDIDAGKDTTPVADGGELRSEPEETAAEKADLIYSIQTSLKQVDDMLREVASPNTVVGHYVMGDAEYNQILHSVTVFERGMRTLASAGSPAGKMVFSEAMYVRLEKPLVKLDGTLQAMQQGKGMAGRLFASDELYNKMVSEVQDVRKSLVQIRGDLEKSSAGLQDDESYRKITRMLASTDAMLAALNRGEGTAGALLTSPQLYESLAGSLKGIQDLLRDFDSNPRKYERIKVF